MPLLNWPSVEDFVTSLGITFHLQMASGMNDFLRISSLHFGTIYFPHFEYYIVHFFENWQLCHIGIEVQCLYAFCTLLSIWLFYFFRTMVPSQFQNIKIRWMLKQASQSQFLQHIVALSTFNLSVSKIEQPSQTSEHIPIMALQSGIHF